MNTKLLLRVAEQMGLVYEDKSGNEIPFDPSPDTVEDRAQLYGIETWLGRKHGIVIAASFSALDDSFTGWQARTVGIVPSWWSKNYLERHEAIFAACQWLYDNKRDEGVE